jgi:acetoin utilization deacetylase AcuC-like enzyme
MSESVASGHVHANASSASEMQKQSQELKQTRLLVLYDRACLLHKTIELLGSSLVPAYESPERLENIHSALAKHSGRFEIVEVKRQSGGNNGNVNADANANADGTLDALLAASHDVGYIQHLKTIHAKWVAEGLIPEDGQVLPECFRVTSVASRAPREPVDPFARSGYYAFDMSTGICKDTWTSIAASARLAIEAVRHMLDSKRDVLALCRPPGHHCTTNMAGGYCYVNNAVVAVEALRSAKKEKEEGPKVAILDLDFHHGNGTQDYFYHDPAVLYVSIHGENEYPYYTGFREEAGNGRAEGANVNLPLKTGASVEEYLELVGRAVEIMVAFEPEFLFVSLGFDTFKGDPLGCFMIETEDYEKIAECVRQESSGLSIVPAVILLEGGYVVQKLGENMLAFLKGWGVR